MLDMRSSACATAAALTLLPGYGLAAATPPSPAGAARVEGDGVEAERRLELSLDGFGGPMVHLTQLRGEPVVFFGGRGAGNVTEHFIVGGGGCGLLGTIAIPAASPASRRTLMKMGYGGLELGYVFNPEDVVNVSANLLMGAGMLIRIDAAGAKRDYVWFFAVEPAVYVNVNLTSFLRINLGVKYRRPGGIDVAWISSRELQGFAGSIALLFGRRQAGTRELIHGGEHGG